ncbi:MAG: FAD:protein FMN transferase, partial [Rhodospirillales bacterium]|nr:FAD:protein FMN transferase [Rhodospirillales bacterium]
YSHIIDPRSGAPVEHALAAVSVVARSAMTADALATALMVLGPDRGLRLARRRRLAALFMVRRGEGFAEARTPEFDRALVV